MLTAFLLLSMALAVNGVTVSDTIILGAGESHHESFEGTSITISYIVRATNATFNVMIMSYRSYENFIMGNPYTYYESLSRVDVQTTVLQPTETLLDDGRNIFIITATNSTSVYFEFAYVPTINDSGDGTEVTVGYLVAGTIFLVALTLFVYVYRKCHHTGKEKPIVPI